MAMIEVKISDEDLDGFEGANHELIARQNIIAFYLEKGMDTDTDVFRKYHEEYVRFFMEVEQRKMAIESKYLEEYSNRRRYWIDTAKRIIRVEVIDNETSN